MLTERVIALLVLLYAQPPPKITRLTVDDTTVDNTTVDDGQMLTRLSDPPAPVPPPFDAIISQYLAARPNLTTATNPGSRWLFPGRRAGQPCTPPPCDSGSTTPAFPTSAAAPARPARCSFTCSIGRGRHAHYTPKQGRNHRCRGRRHLEALRPGDHTRTRRPNKRR
jgi:hypothetical protein